MTVPANSDYVATSIANGVTVNFPFGFKVTAADDLAVEVNGVAQAGGYTVGGVGEPSGVVIFGSPPVAGARVTRYLNPIFKRETNFQQFGDWMAPVVNLDFDRIWLAMQSLLQFRKRAIKLPVETTTDQVITADAAGRANKLLGFDAGGDLTLKASVEVGANIVSAYAATLLDDVNAAAALQTLGASATGSSLFQSASAAAARAALGLGTAAAANTGSAPGDVPLLDGLGRLPALDGGQLIGLSAAQVNAALGYTPRRSNRVTRLVGRNGYSAFGVITEDNRLVIWGGDAGHTYAAGANRRTKPMVVHFPGETGTLLEAGVLNTWCYAWFDSGNYYAWGENSNGVLGDGSTTTRQLPNMPTGLAPGVANPTLVNVTAIYPPQCAGYSHSETRMFLKKSDGYIYACGYNAFGALGINSTASQSSFVKVTDLGTDVRMLWNLGASYGCAFAQKNDGGIWAVGYNSEGQLGIGSKDNQSRFVDVSNFWGGNTGEVIARVGGGFGGYDGTSAASSGMVAMLRGGKVYTCGYNSYGQVGNGSTGSSVVTPYPVPGLGTVTDIVTFGGYVTSVYALSSGNRLYRWGHNGNGQLGDGLTASRNAPYNSGAGIDCAVTQIFNHGADGHTYGWYHAMFIKSGGLVYGAGYGGGGQVGDGGNVSRSNWSRVRVGEADMFTDIRGMGYGTVCTYWGLCPDGRVMAWGNAGSYRIDQSNGDSFDCYVPVNFSLGGL